MWLTNLIYKATYWPQREANEKLHFTSFWTWKHRNNVYPLLTLRLNEVKTHVKCAVLYCDVIVILLLNLFYSILAYFYPLFYFTLLNCYLWVFSSRLVFLSYPVLILCMSCVKICQELHHRSFCNITTLGKTTNIFCYLVSNCDEYKSGSCWFHTDVSQKTMGKKFSTQPQK